MLILVSNSPRRKEILQKLGFEFLCKPVDVDETIPLKADAEGIAQLLAERKAGAGLLINPDDTVIGSDTVVVLENKILGKPKDKADATRMLKLLSDKTHTVYTGVCIKNKNKTVAFTESTKVCFAALTDDEINNYIETGEPMDKAGAYAIQGVGCKFIKWIKGDYYAVMGLPSNSLYKALKNMED